MNERIHAHLDGDIPLHALTPAERARLAEMEDALGAAVRHLRAVPSPELAGRVMAALPAHAPRRRGALDGALDWLWRPRTLRLVFRPAYGVAGALAATAAVAVLPSVDAPGEPAPVETLAAAAPPVYVQFRLEAAGAQKVALAGTFTGWQPAVQLRETAPGEWSAVVPLRPGVHDYAFVVDGRRWVADPHAAQVDDSFGGVNSRISLPPVHQNS
ncbi:MAG: hypothetical protein AVDCRST_MAG68-4158 [uncultured Gemmatimonadetes bacterium]|uniref:AMP-activated protein kinase glycogen-binding domain-containing protein n=1 Tax=uncultured Gemmatimonadota bacterium TaxID=203437 RepID=A0A6J4MH84_9BACT|nr:MAG: hypothetical protein AVDCRST_MAG68-4158 [uncultured Gemmatimonadota bacterium]